MGIGICVAGELCIPLQGEVEDVVWERCVKPLVFGGEMCAASDVLTEGVVNAFMESKVQLRVRPCAMFLYGQYLEPVRCV